MSAIAGIVGTGDYRPFVEAMLATMAHRGEVVALYSVGANLHLGESHASAAPRAGAAAPLRNEAGNLTLLCDGTIYNAPQLRVELEKLGHTFATPEHHEVVVHLFEEYGTAAFARLRGAFAVVIWDDATGSLLLVRDQMGQRPLFYAAGNSFSFASEPKALLKSGLVAALPDLNALWHYMSLRFLPDGYSCFKGVAKLPAATWLRRQRDGTCHSERYWQPDFNRKFDCSEDEAVERLDTLLAETTRLHLIGDEPIGSFLSGGIDSGLITALMAEACATPFPTFSIGVREQKINELPYARMVVDKYHLQGREQIVEADLVHLMPAMIHHLDEPSDPFGVGVYLVSREAAREVRVALSGDGGDENFAGYDRFAGQRLVDYYAWLPVGLRRHLLGHLINLVPESFGYKSAAAKLKWLHAMSFHDAGSRYAASMSFLRFTNEHKELLFTAKAQAALSDPDSDAKILTHYNSSHAAEAIDRMLYTDLMTRMPDHLLSISDRMSAAHGLEVRPPLIDHVVTDFAASLPGRYKLKGRSLKHILRRVALRHLPHELINRPKQGFGFPIAAWLRSDLRHFTRNLLLHDSHFVANGIFEAAFVERLVNEHQEGRADHNFRLWILLNLEIWHRLYFEGLSLSDCHAEIERLLR